MTANLETHSIESSTAVEIYISAVPSEGASLQDQAKEIFSGIRNVLQSKGAYIFQERVFAAKNAMQAISEIRSKVYSDIDDGVAPTFLVCSEGMFGPLSGVQVHAVSSDSKPEVINLEGTARGRLLRVAGRSCLTLSGVSAAQFSQPTEQARAMMEKAESALKQFGADFVLVPRTWMWLCDILSWYGDFNQVRNEFFIERGIIGEGSRQSMPASTGIGLSPADGSKCAMDLVAVLEPADSIQYLQAVGKQQCALEYGSAFSRASRAVMPAGETVFVSGTASIDASGATTNVGDAHGQITATIENVRAVLRDMDCRDKDVVQAIAYCKTVEVEQAFCGLKGDVTWPWVTCICDVCRPELLFEVEATAVPRR